jgi:ABC-type branched-subunit amino acid transport system substrate-binding protein
MTRPFAAAAIILVTASLAAAPKLSEQEARGKQIYLHGESSGGKSITALMGGEGVEVPATIVPCASCHGIDARGRAEGGVKPSDLRWDVLTRPYEAPGERSHPPYTRSAIKRAVTMGVDPAGHKLQPVMPRYRMSLSQIDDLIAYLEKLPSDSDPGLTGDTIRIGIVIPEDGHAAGARTLDERYVERINRAGGIFGRRIELRFVPSTKSLQSFIDDEQPFAIAASSLIGNEDEFESVVERNQLPAIAAIATHEPKGRYSFHILAGLYEQSVALAQYAVRRGARSPSIVATDEQPWRGIAAEVKGKTKLPACRMAEVPGCLTTGDAVIVIGPPSLQRDVLRAAAASPNPLFVLIPGSIAGSVDNLPATLDGRAAIAVPLLPSDASPAGAAGLHDFISPAVTGAFLSLELLVEAFRRAGHDIGREKLIETIEGFYAIDSGLTPKISFGPNRHTGTSSAHILLWSAKERMFVPDDETRQEP